MSDLFQKTVDFVKELYPNDRPVVPLHAPRFNGNEKKYLNQCIDSTFVSYVGEFVTRFEQHCRDFCGVKHAIATVNGTEALHVALLLSGVRPGDEVITQSLTFVATANAISYCGAAPIFLDVDQETMGLSPEALRRFLTHETTKGPDGFPINKKTNRRISAVVPMHTFGHPVRIDEILELCTHFSLELVEDSAEALGSFYKSKHLGSFGRIGILSFNGNKPVTTGGGGMIITNDQTLADKAKHMTTTAKIPHKWEFVHDEIAYNFRLPNVNAAIGCAQMEQLEWNIQNKRKTALEYQDFFSGTDISFFHEPEHAVSNYWLNAVLLKNREARDDFLSFMNNSGVQTRPIWTLMNRLKMFERFQTDDLAISQWFADRVVNLPSSVRI